MQWPSHKPASAAQSKRFKSGALFLLLLMIPGNDPTDRRMPMR
jgi:hypothetical protein